VTIIESSNRTTRISEIERAIDGRERGRERGIERHPSSVRPFISKCGYASMNINLDELTRNCFQSGFSASKVPPICSTIVLN